MLRAREPPTCHPGEVVSDQTPSPPPDPERGWPPRFDNATIGWAAVALLILFLAVAGWFRSVFHSADLLDAGDEAAEHAAAYVLFVLGLLSILAGILFALIEQRRPPAAAPSPQIPAARGAQDVVGAVGKVVETFKDKKVSTILFSIGLVLIGLAAAGSGLVDVSIGEDAGGSVAEPEAG